MKTEMETLTGTEPSLDVPPPTTENGADVEGPWWQLDERTASLLRDVVRIGINVAVVGFACWFVLLQMGPRHLLLDTTPAGGDMGAHVWGPAYLRDHLLPSGQLTGWTPDWYNGFPAYHFYMVVPALFIVALDIGWSGAAALVAVAAAAVLGLQAFFRPPRSTSRRVWLAAAAAVLLLGVGMPYGTAFKLVSASGVVLMPLCAYLMGRLLRLPFPAPALFALATIAFLFNREPLDNGTGNIIGGNVTSTLAGEFSFSLSLSFALLYLGCLIAGLRTGRYRGLAAVLLALTTLCHLIPAIWALVATAVALVVWPSVQRVKWAAVAVPLGGLLTSFWTLPFLLRRDYLNDMGWEKLPGGAAGQSPLDMVTDGSLREKILDVYLFPKSLWWIVAFAVVGVVVSIALRIRVGWWLAATTALMGVAFIVAPETRLWNARLLPFWYLGLCLLAALGVAEMARAVAVLVARDPERPVFSIQAAAPAFVLAIVMFVVALPLGALEHWGGSQETSGRFTWGPFSTAAPPNPAPSWARWNYLGYERKPAYPEYYDLMDTMARVGREEGCGRLFWEYEGPRLERYGTPMAPMLLPFWTDGCIGSQEGLYFEASSTTPYHFLMQAELSAQCSCAQRNLPYGGFDMDKGVRHLQLMGVRYYAASTTTAIDAASQHPDLEEIAVAGPWHVYLVADSELVSPLENEPVVVTAQTTGVDWIYGNSSPHSSPIKADGPAVAWFTDETRWDVPVAASGPRSWARIEPGDTAPARPLDDVRVENIVTGTDSISFDVDRTGVPVLVKASYFPNWEVSGGEGPYRVAPNLMVVIPTATHVTLSYGTTPVDYVSYLFTGIGLSALLLLARRPPVPMPPPDPTSDEILYRYLSGADASPPEAATDAELEAADVEAATDAELETGEAAGRPPPEPSPPEPSPAE